MIRVLLVAFLCFCVHANVTVEYQQIKEGQGPHCVDKEGSTRSLGEMWQEKGRCSKTRCLASVDDRAILQVHGCKKVQATADCEVVVPPNKDLPYPECCPLLNCKTRRR
uniref:Single domain-containing protein n=2 Tax=Lygus hesperus TaxID=30085 RepID=A0A146KUS4_LYGHE